MFEDNSFRASFKGGITCVLFLASCPVSLSDNKLIQFGKSDLV